jgi:phosphoglycolate phosphatase
MKRKDHWHTLFWDLDGTITDPRRGIIDAYAAFLTEAGIPVPPESELLWVIGPPLRECLTTLLRTTDQEVIERAVLRYRHWYVTEGLMYRDTPYAGIETLLRDLRQLGYRMFIATAKAHAYARLILRHWGLEDVFDDIHGSEIDGTRANKGDLLQWMICEKNIQPIQGILMIGDRKHDVLAAKKNGIQSVGVGYGYGSKEELSAAGTDLFCQTLEDLRCLLVQR